MNPFESTESFSTGFYFDSKQTRLVYLYKDSVEEEAKAKIYNALANNVDMNIIFSDKSKYISKSTNLVPLTIDVVKNNIIEIKKDFAWISDSSLVTKTFISFLLEEEKYLILELFKHYLENGRK